MRSAKMTSPVKKRSLTLGGHKTSVSLESEFWLALKEIAAEKQTTLLSCVRKLIRTAPEIYPPLCDYMFWPTMWRDPTKLWSANLQCGQVVRCVAISLNNLGVAEVAFVRIAGAAKCDGPDIFGILTEGSCGRFCQA